MKRALMREYMFVQWHMNNMSWVQFLGLTFMDRYLMFDECNALIRKHNEEAGVPKGDDD